MILNKLHLMAMELVHLLIIVSMIGIYTEVAVHVLIAQHFMDQVVTQVTVIMKIVDAQI